MPQPLPQPLAQKLPQKLAPGLSGKHFMHPLDRTSMQAVIERITGSLVRGQIERLMKEAEEEFYLLNLADNTRLDHSQGGSLYRLVVEAVRLHEISEWATSDEYQRLLRGQYALPASEADALAGEATSQQSGVSNYVTKLGRSAGSALTGLFARASASPNAPAPSESGAETNGQDATAPVEIDDALAGDKE